MMIVDIPVNLVQNLAAAQAAALVALYHQALQVPTLQTLATPPVQVPTRRIPLSRATRRTRIRANARREREGRSITHM